MSPAPATWLALLLLGQGLLACSVAPVPLVEATDMPRREWLPDSPPRAVILAVHGFNDYSNAFTDFGEYAASRGIAVHAYDQRGFGANPDAGLWPGIPLLVADLRRERERLAELYPERPVYLLGESMGAAVLIAAVANEVPLAAAGIIMTAPAVWGGDQLNPLYRATLWLASRVAPGLKLTGRDLGIMASDNLDVLQALGADPLFIKATRVDAIAGLVGLMDLAYAEARAVPGPLLILGGARDEIVPPKAHLAVLERLTADPCLEIVYPEGWHLLLRDLQRQVVWDDILAWVDGAPPPSGLAEPCGGAVTVAAAAPG
ncbi:MAG TPA: lysophospholipase [Geminicoccaceae bacterium]|nr:lysophospholipase [Geminicoccaceae bacterium]